MAEQVAFRTLDKYLFYQDEWATIYCGDCREILPMLPQPDLVVTDPPYGINYQSAWRIAWQRKPKINDDDNFPHWLFDIVSPKVAMLVWCRWDTLPQMPKPTSLIVWDKGRHSMGNLQHEFGRQWEACAFYPGTDHRFFYRPKDIIRCDAIPPEQLKHPCEKPAGVMIPLIACHPCSLLIDPFCGSGSTLMAAKCLHRKSIGIEIEEKYCALAVERLRQSVMDFRQVDGINGVKEERK